MCELELLSQLIKEKNRIDKKISAITGRPALIGHTGEYTASLIFGIRLEISATSPGYDGRFISGKLAGKTVNIKWYTKNEGILDISEKYTPDYYLVLTGPTVPAESSRNKTRPWLIRSVFIFDAVEIINKLKSRGVKTGIATSLLREYWDSAELYPVQRNHCLQLSEEQRGMLELFSNE